MLKVHFVAGTRAGRVVWLLEELGLEYEINIMPFTKEGLKSPEHRARHALGRVPVLEDGDVSIFESGAIIDYILERHKNGGLKPSPDVAEFPFYLQWYHYCEGMVMPPMNQIVVQTLLLPPDRRDETVLNQATNLLGKSLVPMGDCACITFNNIEIVLNSNRSQTFSTDVFEKLGIERRIYTSGKSKSMLDPFIESKENA